MIQMYTHTHSHTRTYTYIHTQCAITRPILAHEFSELAAELMLMSENGEVCNVESEDDHNHDEEEDEDHESEEGKLVKQ